MGRERGGPVKKERQKFGDIYFFGELLTAYCFHLL